MKMKRCLPFVIVVVVALVTLGSATMLYRARRLPVLALSKNQVAPGKESAEPLHIRGKPNAPVTLEEFGDFQCPPCGKLADPIKQLEKDYDPHLCVIFHHFPLPTHQHAREAALAAEAAGLQNRFWEMHDLLYREQSIWSKAADVHELFNAYAGILGLNIDRFKKDLESPQVNERVTSDQKHGAALGVQNTPTIFLNNHALDPKNLNPVDLRAAIDKALKEKETKKG
jgi:protein-disulfide isomerase